MDLDYGEETKMKTGFCDHKTHDTVKVNIAFNNERPLPDLPRVTINMKLNVFEFPKYQGTPGYCPGDDEFGLSTMTQRIWEGMETAVAIDILKEPGRVLDFGANAGWYTCLAKGHEVRAFEADNDIAVLLEKNIELNGINAVVHKHWIDEESPQLDPTSYGEILLMKSDLEGFDKYAVKMCKGLFENKKIKYALIEISPVLQPGYQELVDEIVGYGYKAYMVPNKGFEHIEEYEKAPLETIQKYCQAPPVEGLRQQNFIFIRE